MILPNTKIHIIQKHLPRSLKIQANDKIKQFKRERLYSASTPEIVGRLIDYDVIDNNKDCGGYCDYENRRLGMSNGVSYKVIFHEIGHALQAKDGMFSNCDGTISQQLNLEWQTETISYILYSNLLNSGISHEIFNSYFSKRDVDFLNNWYKDYGIDYDEPDIKLRLC